MKKGTLRRLNRAQSRSRKSLGLRVLPMLMAAMLGVTAMSSSIAFAAAETAEVQTQETAGTDSSAAETSAAVSIADSGTNPHSYADSSVVDTNGYENWPQGKDIDADYACLLDAASGAVLYSKGKDVQTPPASITKIMTCLLALENGDLDAEVTMTATGTAYATDGSSNLYTQVGEVFTLRDMLYGMMLKSANDMATQIGEYIGGGSLEHFTEMMNERAAALGCRHTHFTNACGMPAEDHLTTAYDMCLITQEAMKNETFREIFGTLQYTIPATNMTEARTFQNHHRWILDSTIAPAGFVGGKTGYTDAALNTLVSVVERDGMQLIAVTMHDNGSEKCIDDSAYLFRYGFRYFRDLVFDDSADLAYGGVAVLPTDASAADIKATEIETTDPVYGEGTKTQYQYNEKKIGSSFLTKAASQARTAAALEAAAAES
ncbi:MAG: D-alanyl-D-alanine carboxypeptidase family protein, partial [Lachnospiraceae bacterium]|nr:D-alanyl-D-alanine carboxypeptidase family protein [Lachnospiraceae bacterium]